MSSATAGLLRGFALVPTLMLGAIGVVCAFVLAGAYVLGTAFVHFMRLSLAIASTAVTREQQSMAKADSSSANQWNGRRWLLSLLVLSSLAVFWEGVGIAAWYGTTWILSSL